MYTKRRRAQIEAEADKLIHGVTRKDGGACLLFAFCFRFYVFTMLKIYNKIKYHSKTSQNKWVKAWEYLRYPYRYPYRKMGKNGMKTKMKILMLTDRMDTGGVETHIAELARGILREGHEVAVFSAGGALAEQLEQEGIRQVYCRVVGKNPLRFLRAWVCLRRLLRKERVPFSVLHAHTRTAGLLLSLMPETSGICRTVTVHSARMGPLTRRMCRRGSVIAVSEDLRTLLIRRRYAEAERICVIPNGVDTVRFSPPPAPPASHLVTFLSRLDRDCALGAELLLEAFPQVARAIPDATLVLAGGGGRVAALRRRAEQLNRLLGRTAVVLTGRVEKPEMLYPKSCVVVGVSRVALEAAACACPVVLLGNEGYGGVLSVDDRVPALSNFCCRGYRQTDPGTLAAVLIRLLSDRDPALQKRVRAWIEQSFSALAMQRRTLELYAELLAPVACKKTVRLLVGGYAGCGNIGDDAILQGLILRLRELHPEVRLEALTGHARMDSRRFGISCTSRRLLPAVALCMLRSDVFLLGGGSLMQDLTGKRSLRYYLFLLRMARFFGCRTGTLALGVGPLLSARSEQAVLQALQTCDPVTLRDADSLRRLALGGCDPSRLMQISDPARFLKPAPEARRVAILHRLGILESTRYFCVSVRPTVPPREELLRSVAAAVRRTARVCGMRPILVVMDAYRDAEASLTVLRLSDCGGSLFFPDEATDVPALLSGAALLLSMRLHALLFAEEVRIPAVALSPCMAEPKLESLARHAGFPHFYAEHADVVPLSAEMERLAGGN